MSLQSHFVTDRRRYGLSPDELIARAARAAAGGVDVIQIRERDLPDGELTRLVRGVLNACAGTAARIVVNDRADIGIAAHAHGVHLRGDSAPVPRVRAITPPGFLIGRSVHSLEEIDEVAAAGGCDYLIFGTVFQSAGKPAGHAIAGLDLLREACRRSPIPVIAIGGIDLSRVDAIASTGAAGFAAVGMFM